MKKSNKVKFQWSKVAGVLGSYEDFIKAYGMSINSAGFSNDQIAAQLDTISRKMQQLKATMTGIATGIGASGLSAYIKDMISRLNSFAQALQKTPAHVWRMVGGFIAVAGAIGACLTIVRLFTAGMKSLIAAQTVYAGIVAGTTAVTEGWAAAMTAATGGLNILLGLVVAGAAAFLGYNALVSTSIDGINKESQALEDNIQIKRQQIETIGEQSEFIATLCESHVKLQKALDETSEGTEKNEQLKRALAATDKELTDIVGEDAVKQIDWNGDIQVSIKGLQDAHSKKTQKLKQELASALEAQAAYNDAEQVRIENEITMLENEKTAWQILGDTITSICRGIANATIALGEQIQGLGAKVKEFMPSWGDRLSGLGDSIVASGEKYAKVEFKPRSEDDQGIGKENRQKVAALKNDLAKAKAASAKSRLEAGRIRTGTDTKPIDDDDSGIVTDDPVKGSKAKGGSGKGGAGAKEADNSIEAILYRFLTKDKKLSHNRAIGELANVQAMSNFDYKAGEGTDRRGLYGWNQKQWAEYEKWLAGTGYKDSAVSQINYKHTWAEKYDKEEKEKYQAYLREGSSTPQEFAQAYSDNISKIGTIDTAIVDALDKRFAKKNGEENYSDPMKDMAERYGLLKNEFTDALNELKTERAKEGEKVTAEEELKLFEKLMGIGDGKNPFAYLEQAQKDYQKQLLEVAKYEAKRQEDIKKSTETQVKAIEKMADSEIAFAEKIGLINKADVRNYEYEKNERNYATKMPALSAKLGATVDMSKGTADDMVNLYKSLIHAQDAYEAEHYAKKIFSLSRDVDATQKALGEMLKLEQSYQDKRAKLEQDAFEYKNRYTLKFIDSLSSAIGSSLEGILNRTKTFAEAFRDIFKAVVNDIIKLFSEDFAQRIKKWLTNAIYKPKATGNPAGSYVDTDMYYGGKKSKGNRFNLLGWAGGKNGVSLLGGGYGKSNPLLKAMGLTPNLAAQAKAMITPVTYTLRNSVKTTFDGLSNLTAQGMNTISAGVQTGTEAMSMTFGNYKVMQVQTNEIGDNAIIAKNQSTAATVQATSTAMMGWLMAILALFSLFGGHKGDKTSHSTSSTNLGRAPETYYMTPTPVMQSTNYTVPSMDIGGNIERDMLIFAHKNEMVLTPEQADVIRSTARAGGNMGNSGNASASVKSNINVSTVDSRGFDRVLRDYSRDLSKNIKKSIRNGYLNAKGLV